jgi:hypothetical protein
MQTRMAVMEPLEAVILLGSPEFYKRPCIRQYLSTWYKVRHIHKRQTHLLIREMLHKDYYRKC